MRIEIEIFRRLKNGKTKALKPVVRLASSSAAALENECRRRNLNWFLRRPVNSPLLKSDKLPPGDFELRARRWRSGHNWLRYYVSPLPRA